MEGIYINSDFIAGKHGEHIIHVAINYKDGTNYVVMESNADGRHSCDVEKDNTAYSCGTLTGEYVMLFNRLVDTDQISSITVNDVEYTLE